MFFTSSRFRCVLALLGALWLAKPGAHAAAIAIPNFSFEGPTTTFAREDMDFWQEQPKPLEYNDEEGQYPWSQLTGVFKNTAVGTSTHYPGINGSQAGYIFNVAGNGIYQVLSNATYTANTRYAFTLGFHGGGGGMIEPTNPQEEGYATFVLRFFYLDQFNQKQTVAELPVAYTEAAFPDARLFVDRAVTTAPVLTGDAWLGKNIGIELLITTENPDLARGYWDIDNARLVSTPVPEPSSAALLGAGALALLGRRRPVRS